MANVNRTTYKNDWQRKHADRISLNVPKGQREEIRGHAHTHGESINGFINRAINEAIARDQEEDKREGQLAQIAAERGISAEEVEHEMKVEAALALLERDVPGIQDFYAKMRMVRRMSGKI